MIGNEFNKLRQTNRSAAYRKKQQLINEFFNILTAIIPPKDLLDESRRCEEFISDHASTAGASPLDELAEFLNGKNERSVH